MKATYIILIGIFLLSSFLRFKNIDQIPHGLYIDEVSIGYNAAKILQTGKDEYGVITPLFFKAFGEYKMPVEIYLTSASIALFGKNEFAVRFPSAFFGTLTVLLLFFFTKLLFKDNRIALVASFLLAITPWHIQFSRGGFEANTALFLYLLGGFLYLHFLKNKKMVWLVVASACFMTTMYTYNAYKLIAPLTLLVSFIYAYKTMMGLRRLLSMVFVCCCVLFLPLIFFTGGNARFFETSAFADYQNLSFFQQLITYPPLYLKNYLSHFSLPYLFITGDGYGRHTVTGMGLLFRAELPFLLAGFFFLLPQRRLFFVKVLLLLLLLSPLTAAFTRPSPHALRAFLLVIPLTIITAYGVVTLWEKRRKALMVLMVGIGFFAVYEFCLYLHLYYAHYPNRTAFDWGAEYKQVIQQASVRQKDYSMIVIHKNIGMINAYKNFYNESLSYVYIDNTWKKPQELKDKKVLYITTSDEKENPYLKTIPHKPVLNIVMPSAHEGVFAKFWEL